LIHQIPPKPDYLRVKVRRRLHHIGAVALKNSVYVLPMSDDAMEDFQWVRRMVVEEGGEAMLCGTVFLDGVDDPGVEGMFRASADAAYAELLEAAEAAASRPTGADVRRLTRQLEQVAARDFFGGERAGEAARAIRTLEEAVEGESGAALPAEGPVASDTGPCPDGATWVTRAGVRVDRMASAWLIRRFIDPNARFKFVPAEGYAPEPGELRFDMFEGEFTHRGEGCTFEVLLAHFGLRDPALRAVADVVHDIDCKDGRFGREETAGVASLIRGITDSVRDDPARLEAGAPLFDGLHAAFLSRRK